MRQADVNKVSVFVCGAQKAGTTSLYSYFLEHSELQDPDRKEIHFFDDEAIDWMQPNYELLHRHFDGPVVDRLRYDITPIYQFWPNALERIAIYNPEAKLIFLFRDPFERAVSHWAMSVARNAEHLDFGHAIRDGRERLRDLPVNAPEWRVFSYLERGLYGQQIAKALRLFPRRQLLFLQAKHLRDAHTATLDRVRRFLCISRFPDSDQKRENGRYATPGFIGPGTEDLKYVSDFIATDMERFKMLTGLDVSDWPTQMALSPGE